MSHYTVLVIHSKDGDVDALLAPYDENLKTHEYEKGVVSDEEKKSFIEAYKEDSKGETDMDKLYEEYGEEWNSNSWHKDEDGVWKEHSSYNPNSKWDWYQIGGRWTGFWKLKPGARGKLGEPSLIAVSKSGEDAYGKEGEADIVRKGDIDFESMQEKAAIQAAYDWDRATKLLGDTLKEHKTWEQVKKEEGVADIEKTRKVYHEQESYKTWKKAEAIIEDKTKSIEKKY